MVGALRWPTCLAMPIEVALPSANPLAGSWQVAQATVPSAESRPSKNSFWPSATLSGVVGLSGGVTAAVSSCGRPAWSARFGWPNVPAFGMSPRATVQQKSSNRPAVRRMHASM